MAYVAQRNGKVNTKLYPMGLLVVMAGTVFLGPYPGPEADRKAKTL